MSSRSRNEEDDSNPSCRKEEEGGKDLEETLGVAVIDEVAEDADEDEEEEEEEEEDEEDAEEDFRLEGDVIIFSTDFSSGINRSIMSSRWINLDFLTRS